MTTAKGYTEMKDSGIQWIGQVPTHWLLKKAKYCVSITNGSDPKSEGSVPVYGSGSESFKTCGEYKEGPAVLIGRKGATLHIPHYIEGRYWNVDTALDVKPQEGFSLRYYYYLACVFDYNYYISQTTLPGMTQTNYNNMKLPCPSLDEQSAIAAYLDTQCAKIDEIIVEAKASIEDYKQWKSSIIYEAVTKGLDPDVEMKDSGVEWVGKVPTHWLLKKAKYCVFITNGSDPKTEGNTPVYGSGADSFKTCGEYKNGPAVLIGRKGATLHIPHYIEGRYWNVDTAFDVKAKKEFSLRYYYYLACVFDYNYYISQTTLPGMTQTNYNNMKLPCPSLEEQSTIATYLDTQCAKIDELVVKKQSLIDDLESYKKSLIYEVVTGKRRVV